VRAFVRRCASRCSDEIADVPRTRRPAVDAGRLSLVDEAEVEVDVEMSRVIEAIRSVAEHELRELQTFTSALAGDMDVARDYNPFRPRRDGRALWDGVAGAADAARLPAGLHAPCLHAAGPGAAQVLRRRLRAAGVDGRRARRLPHHHRLRQPAHARGAAGRLLRPRANRVESSTLPARHAGHRCAAAPDARGARRGCHRAGADATDELLRNLPPTSTATSASTCATCSAQQMLVSADPSAGRPRTDRADGRLFDNMLGDRRLAPDIQNLVSRLQAPALRLALRDPTVLDNYTHPCGC
jgi:hypothetical protein